MKEISLNYPIKSKESQQPVNPIMDMKRLLANRQKVRELIDSINLVVKSHG